MDRPVDSFRSLAELDQEIRSVGRAIEERSVIQENLLEVQRLAREVTQIIARGIYSSSTSEACDCSHCAGNTSGQQTEGSSHYHPQGQNRNSPGTGTEYCATDKILLT